MSHAFKEINVNVVADPPKIKNFSRSVLYFVIKKPCKVPDATPEHGKAPSAAAVSAQPINPSSTPSSTAGTQKPTESSPAHDQKPTAVPIAPTVKPDNHPETKQPGTVVPTISNNTPPASTAGKTEKTDQSTKEGTTVPTAAPTTPKPAQSTTASSTAKPTETSDAPLQARG